MKLQKRRKKKLALILTIACIVTAVIVMILLFLLNKTSYTLADDLVFEINSEKKTSELFETINMGTLEDGNATIDTSELGEKTQIVNIVGFFGIKTPVEISYKIVDTTAPVINGDNALTIFKNDVSDLSAHYQITDNSNQDTVTEIIGGCDTTIIGSCNVTIVAKDKSGNETKKDIVINVVKDPEIAKLNKSEYSIKVNRKQNVVMVYALDKNGEYNNLVKTFVSSTGKVGSETILGTFTTSYKYESLFLVGDVWGRYAVRISGPYLFHSVPYFTKGNPYWDNLEYLEYNKLGEGASAGCVRLALKDAKWIYDNITFGTTVEIFDADSLPDGMVKPEAIKIDTESANRGWDPTDAEPNNPWNK